MRTSRPTRERGPRPLPLATAAALGVLLAWPSPGAADRSDDIDTALTACAAIDNKNIRSACLDAILTEFGYRGEGAVRSGQTAAEREQGSAMPADTGTPKLPDSTRPDEPQAVLIEDAVIPTSEDRLTTEDRLPANPVVGGEASTPAPQDDAGAAASERPPGPDSAPRKPVRVIDLRAAAPEATAASDGPAEAASEGAAPIPLPRPAGATGSDADDADETNPDRAGTGDQTAAIPSPAPERQIDAPASGAPGSWQLTTGPAAVSGQDLFLRAGAAGQVRDDAGRRINPVLWIACRGAGTSLFVDWDRQIRGATAEVSVSIDGAAEEDLQLLVNVDQKSVGWWRDEDAQPRIRALFGKSTLHLGLATPGGGRIRASFDVSGLEGQIVPLRQACGW